MKVKVTLLAAVVAIFAIGVMFSNAQQEKPKAKAVEFSIGGEKVFSKGQPVVAAPKVIDFTLKNLEGKEVKLSEFSKDKVLLLKFGTTWCPPCKQEIPVMNKIAETYKDKVAVIEVDIVTWELPQMKAEDRNVEKVIEKVKEHAQANKAKYTVVLDEEGAVAKSYGVKSIPHIIVAKGDKVTKFEGFKTFEDLKTAIDGLLGGDKKAGDKKAEEKK